MSASNIYKVLNESTQSESEDTVIPLEPDWRNDDVGREVYSIPFNLAQLEAQLCTGATFTIDLLQQIRANKIAIHSEMRKARHLRTLTKVDLQTRFGNYKVWSRQEDDDKAENNYGCVTVRLMSRVELHPDFQHKFWKFSAINRILRVTNELQGKNNWVPVPYALVLDTTPWNNEHKDKKIMQGYFNALQTTKRLWLESSSRKKIVQMTERLAARYKNITKIVCFGLGAINHDKAFYESSLQHMTAFTIAKHLEQIYKTQSLHTGAVQVILQDPCYTQKDRELLGKLYQGGTLSFASDPDGLLAVDSNTIVMTAFLPVRYPLMQIIADMFHGMEGKGPAAMICDELDLNPHQELYALGNRSSPAVARFLTQQYAVSDFKDHVLEPELADNLFGADHTDRHWLSSMHLHMRRAREA
ncbi:hypothetical protein OPT61_g7441 [Boeremia exigua]|uniref:Uncharacterized protein n=1 Tax=Boeremia exigua TaxID=749465 RepID=A0ACC2I2M3_9PLEO|nr:hypothetical protein OPT61_g7441 [Boeremia exigua]